MCGKGRRQVSTLHTAHMSLSLDSAIASAAAYFTRELSDPPGSSFAETQYLPRFCGTSLLQSIAFAAVFALKSNSAAHDVYGFGGWWCFVVTDEA